MLGHAFHPIKIYSESRIAVNGGVRGDNDLPLYAQLCDADTLVTDLLSNKYILRYHYGIHHCSHGQQESLLQPVHIREAGHSLNDTHLHEAHAPPSSQTLVADGHTLKLFSNGVHVFLNGQKPRQVDYKHYPVIFLTKPYDWSPSVLSYRANQAQNQYLRLQSNISSTRRLASDFVSSVRRRNFVNDKGVMDRRSNAGGQRSVEPDHDYNEFAAVPTFLVPVTELVGHKQNRKIWKGNPPVHKFVYINGKYIPFSDPHIDNVNSEVSSKMITFWSQILGIKDPKKVAATLRNTTQRVVMADANFPLNFVKARAPQLNERRLNGIVYTDTAFSNIVSLHGCTCFQVFLHMPSGKVHVEFMRSKKSLPVALSNYSMGHGTPNHLHGDRAAELMGGECKQYCRLRAIKLTHTGEAGKQNQNGHCENMIGILKKMTFLFLEQAPLHPLLWEYAMMYAVVVWNATSKRRLMNASPDQLFYGDTQDISHLRFPFGAAVLFRVHSPSFPMATGLSKGIYLGPNTRDGDAFTYFVLDITTKRIFSRCVVQLDPTCSFHRIYSNMLHNMDFFTDEKHSCPVDADAPPPEWVPVLIHEGDAPDTNIREHSTVDPEPRTCSKSTGGIVDAGKCDDGKSPLFSNPSKPVWLTTNGTFPPFVYAPSADILTKIEADSAKERTRRSLVENDTPGKASLITAYPLGTFQSHGLEHSVV